MALIFAVKRLDPYLRFTTFTAIVDHPALKWLLSLKEPTGKFARWIAYLQSYNFEIETRPGIQHVNADGVSLREYTEIPELDDDEPNYGPIPEFVVDQFQCRKRTSTHPPPSPRCSDIIVYLDSGELPEEKKRRTYILSTQLCYFLNSDSLYHVSSKGGRGLRARDHTLVQIAIQRNMFKLFSMKTTTLLYQVVTLV